MNLQRAREVVNTAPKTEVGLAARLVLWELERREELERSDPQRRIAELTAFLETARAVQDEWRQRAQDRAAELEKERAAHNRTNYMLVRNTEIRDFQIMDLTEKVADLEAELGRLRKLEAAVKEVAEAKTVFARARAVQDRIVAHLEPFLSP